MFIIQPSMKAWLCVFICALFLHVDASPMVDDVPAASPVVQRQSSLTPNINPVDGEPAPVDTSPPNINPVDGEPAPVSTPSASPSPSQVFPEAGSGAQPAPSINPLANANVGTIKPNPIKKGYVAFGDSFAAGIGTGSTEWNGCRQGQFSYPKLIAATAAHIKPDFQNLACSGAVIDDLLQGDPKSQVDSWVNPRECGHRNAHDWGQRSQVLQHNGCLRNSTRGLGVR